MADGAHRCFPMVSADLSCTGIGLPQSLTCEEVSVARKDEKQIQATHAGWETVAGRCKDCGTAVICVNVTAGGPLPPLVTVVPSAF